MDESKNKTEWWQTFFYGPWQNLQLSGYPEEQNKAEAVFIASALRLQPGDTVLDVPCGQGRHSIEFAKAGFRPTGIDFNANAIECARKMAAESGVAAEFSVADMREFSSTSPFDGAVCFFGSFGYFDDEQNLRFASRVAAALRSGGRFLIDIPVAESLFPKFRERDWHWVTPDPPLRILEEREWDLMSGRVESTWSFVGAETSSHRISMRIYTYKELCDLLRSAGFSRFEAFETGKMDSSFRLGSPRLSLVAEK
jgi:SAM-dependent methyltransferase